MSILSPLWWRSWFCAWSNPYFHTLYPLCVSRPNLSDIPPVVTTWRRASFHREYVFVEEFFLEDQHWIGLLLCLLDRLLWIKCLTWHSQQTQQEQCLLVESNSVESDKVFLTESCCYKHLHQPLVPLPGEHDGFLIVRHHSIELYTVAQALATDPCQHNTVWKHSTLFPKCIKV